MRLVSFAAGGRSSYGVARDGGVVDLGARMGSALPDLRSYLAAGALGLQPPSLRGVEVDFRDDEIAYAPVVPNPGKVICVGVNYAEHRRETGRSEAAYPTIFTRFADSLTGHQTALRLPPQSRELDYEAELAVVIGKPGFQVPEADAMALVAGYACFNDGSVRDWQRHTGQYTPGKNFPATGGFGPELVTPDEVRPLPDLSIVLRLNGEVMQSAVLGDMIFSVAAIIAYVTAFTPLRPGDVIATGTPGGVGSRRDPPVFLTVGDTVEVEIGDVGRLVNGVTLG